MTRAEMLRKMSAKEFTEWMAYDLSKSEKFIEKCKLDKIEEMTPEEEAEQAMKFFKGLRK